MDAGSSRPPAKCGDHLAKIGGASMRLPEHVHFRINAQDHKVLWEIADKEETTVSALLRHSLRSFLAGPLDRVSALRPVRLAGKQKRLHVPASPDGLLALQAIAEQQDTGVAAILRSLVRSLVQDELALGRAGRTSTLREPKT